MLRTSLALAATVAAVGTLAAPAAAQMPGRTYKVSAYGIQRLATTSTIDWEEGCRGERGTETSSLVTRFKTRRSQRMRLTNLAGAFVLLPLGRGDWRVTGSVQGSIERAGAKATCADLNPDGSAKWTPWPPAPDRCVSGDLPPHTATLRYASRELAFATRIADDWLSPLSPGECGSTSVTSLFLDDTVGRVSLGRLRDAADEPIVLRHRDTRRDATDTTTTETTVRTTVYVTLRPV